MSKIAIIGFGNMGKAFYQGLLEIYSSENIFVIEKNLDKLKHLPETQTFTNLELVVDKVDIIFLAIKPQQLEDLTKKLGNILEQKLIISIMAGVSIQKIQNLTNSQKIIRCMPNLAVSVKKSVTAWIASSFVEKNERDLATKIFEQTGLELELENEDQIDSITAISGSGPAYFFYLTELLTQNAQSFGFTPQTSQKIAEMTLFGASNLLQKNNYSAKEWREMVTSKGGTTEAAINCFKENNLDKIFEKGLLKAKKRAKELSN
jgi:pyrroline-5-carboxylate reductase